MFLTHINNKNLNNKKYNNENNYMNNENNNNENNNNTNNENMTNKDNENYYGKEMKVEQVNKLKKNNIVLIWFYATWCGHCNNMRKTWVDLENKPPREMKLAKVESNDYKKYNKSNNEEEVRGYPTIRLYHKNKMIKEYDGERDLGSIQNFAKNYVKENNKVKKNNLLIVRGKKTNEINGKLVNSYIKNKKKSNKPKKKVVASKKKSIKKPRKRLEKKKSKGVEPKIKRKLRRKTKKI